MKNNKVFINIIIVNIFLCLLISCDIDKKNKKTEKYGPLEGVWKLSEFYTLANSDTILKNFTKIQHKIYLNGHVIWNTDPDENGIDWSGYGKYTFKNDTITEILTSMSTSMKSDINTYIIPIDFKGNSYKQVNTYIKNDTVFKNIEVYKKIY